MIENTACSNCTCPINYDCDKFKLFFEGKYTVVEEYQHNHDYTCDFKEDQEQDTASQSLAQNSLF